MPKTFAESGTRIDRYDVRVVVRDDLCNKVICGEVELGADTLNYGSFYRNLVIGSGSYGKAAVERFVRDSLKSAKRYGLADGEMKKLEEVVKQTVETGFENFRKGEAEDGDLVGGIIKKLKEMA